jgi:hypothetical protein
MNRFAFIGAQTDEKGQEWCYILDTQTGTTLKSPVKTMGASPDLKFVVADGPTPPTGREIFPADTAADKKDPEKPRDPAGEPETADERKKRLANPKVPAAFSKNMYNDPSKGNGNADVTPHQ